MGIESVSQDIGQIINFRKDYAGTGSDWKINGVPWTGAVVTVGAGKDYENLRAAIVATQEDSLFLLYPGSYDLVAAETEWNAYKRYFRGTGSSYTDVILTITGYSDIYAATAPEVIFEWMTIYHPMMYDPNETGSIIFNRCNALGHVDKNYFAFNAYFNGVKTPNLTIRNCFMRTYGIGGTRGWLWSRGTGFSGGGYLNITKTYLQKCVTPILASSDPYWAYYVVGAFAENDIMQTPADGYGPDYGTDLITSELAAGEVSSVSQPIGNIINLRRNASNVPGENGAETIQSASQPIGRIIRLRRNASNVPGE